MIGFIFIIIAHIIAILGYNIMPDNTRNANDGAVQIGKLEPGTEVVILKIRKNMIIPEQNFFQKLFSGRESKYTIVPVIDYTIDKEEIKVTDYKVNQFLLHKAHKTKSYSLLNAVKALSVGEHIDFSKIKNENEEFSFTNINEQIETTSLAKLKEEFVKNNVEIRTYWLGTDKSGRDILSMLILGARVSLSIGFIAVVISLFLGVIMGSLAGYFGGKTDDIIQWFMTVVWSIPGIMLVIAISLALSSKGIWVAFVAVGLTMWVDVARVVRGEIFVVKQKNYIESAKALGFSHYRIIFVHILPNILGSLIVIANANFASSILLEASLSFLGLGVQPPTPSWGMMVKEGYSIIGSSGSWGLVTYPGICIMVMVLSFNLFGNGLRDAYDPKSH